MPKGISREKKLILKLDRAAHQSERTYRKMLRAENRWPLQLSVTDRQRVLACWRAALLRQHLATEQHANAVANEQRILRWVLARP